MAAKRIRKPKKINSKTKVFIFLGLLFLGIVLLSYRTSIVKREQIKRNSIEYITSNEPYVTGTTEAQKEESIKNVEKHFSGQWVNWTGRVYSVTDKNQVEIDIYYPFYISSNNILIFGTKVKFYINKNTALTLDKGQIVLIEGKIKRFDYGLRCYVFKNVNITTPSTKQIQEFKVKEKNQMFGERYDKIKFKINQK